MVQDAKQGWNLLDEKIAISNDGFIIDGHHRWTAMKKTGLSNEIINTDEVDLPIDEIWGPKTQRTEEWWQTCQRVVNGANEIGAELSDEESERLFDYMFNLKGTPGGRMLWQLGTPNNFRLGGDSLCNCWFVDIQKPEDFAWMFERLMLGGGVGFSILNPHRLGVVRQGAVDNHNVSDADYIVPDKREGWSECLLRAIKTYLGTANDPTEFSYSTQLVRPAGAPIRTFGGTASGPDILIKGITKICAVLNGAIGRNLHAVEVLDICNIIGSVVVAGNVRRSAEIALGSPFDIDYLSAKRWDIGEVPSHRAMSNNSVVTSNIEGIPDVFWEGYKGNGEPYGLFNLDASRKYGRRGEIREDPSIAGTNPCAEIGLANRESCNLAEIMLPNIESQEELIDISMLLYKVQKAVASLPYLDQESDDITSKNMRLGLGVTGVAQALDKLDWLSPAYEALRDFDRHWSSYKEWPTSVRLTTVKPSGTLSLLAGITPGIHPGYSKHHIRRVRMASTDPLLDYCEKRGYHVEWVENDDRTKVVEFPCEFPEGTTLAHHMTAVEQLELQCRMQEEWADNAVSVTVYIKSGELESVQEFLKKNWPTMKSVSFLLHNEHGFTQAPLEEINQTKYEEILNRVKDDKILVGGGFSELLDDDCSTGACPIR
jgi:ribonucleotide reductase alpha subunit